MPWQRCSAKHDLPVLEPHGDQVAVVGEVEEATPRAVLDLADQIGQQVEAVDVDLVYPFFSVAHVGIALLELVHHVRVPRGRQQCRQPIVVLDDVVGDAARLDLSGPADHLRHRNAPSQLVFFSLRNGVVPASGQLLRCGPLSVE